MTKINRAKNIFSWISFVSGMLSFFIFLFPVTMDFFNINFRGDIFIIISSFCLSVSILAIISGSCGIYYEVNRGIILRSFIGFILGHLCWVMFWIEIFYM